MLSACSGLPSEPRVITVNKVVYVLPPEHLLQECTVTNNKLDTNGELLALAVKLNNQNVLCNVDKAALRKWRTRYE
nr:hypothetical protein [Pseudoalteromonas sp.]